MQRLLRESSTPGDSQRFAIGALVFGGLLFTAGAAPWALPFLYVLFIACAVPWRAWDFSKKKGTFFLLDFCYVSCCSDATNGSPGILMQVACCAALAVLSSKMSLVLLYCFGL